MIRNYFKIAYRSVLRHKATAFISISGLAVGLACFFLLATYLLNELSYDDFNKKAGRIVRVDSFSKQAANNEIRGIAVTPTAVVPVFKHLLPEVEDGVRIYNYSEDQPAVCKYQDKLFSERHVLMADASFFRIFDFKFLAGNAGKALAAPGSLVITASMAKKYFGNDDPIGKVLQMNGKRQMQVTGVIEDVPANSQIKFDMMGTYAMLDRAKTEKWDSGNEYSYLLLKSADQLGHVEQAMNTYIGSLFKDDVKSGNKSWFRLEPLSRIHLHSLVDGGLEVPGNLKYVYILSVVAVLLLLIACINYINLITARAADRAHEIGVRKVMGAKRKQLFVQFITEVALINLLSIAISLVIAALCFNSFIRFTGQELSLAIWNPLQLSAMVVIMFLGITLVAGIYPSLVLSSFNAISTLKSNTGTSNKGGNLFQKALVVFQFVISVVFIFGTLIAKRQLNYLQNTNTGMNRSQVVVLDVGGMPYNDLAAFKDEVTQQPQVLGATASYDSPVNIKGGYMIDGASGKAGNFKLMLNAIPVEKNFIPALGIGLVQGSNFSDADIKQVLPEKSEERIYHFIINETAARALGWTPNEAVGKTLRMGGREGTIKAVAHDFNFASLHDAIAPLVIFPEYSWFGKMFIRTSGHNNHQTIAGIQNIWKRFYPNNPFEFHFLDQEYDEMYRADQRTSNILNAFAIITIIISCMGLFGLAALMVEQRTKEVGIRKVLGASVLSVTALLSADFLKLVGIAIAIAMPLGWYAMQQWLQDFTYRTTVPWWLFVAIAVMVTAFALITVSFNTIKAALTNPVKSLRAE